MKKSGRKPSSRVKAILSPGTTAERASKIAPGADPASFPVVGIGASAGGFEAIKELVSGLPPNFDASIFIVWHMAPHIHGVMPNVLNKLQTVPAAHALDLEGLRAPDVTFWAAWDGDVLLGVGALKRLSNDGAEIKSMHTVADRRRGGVGSAMLLHIIEAARAMGISRLSLETGSWDYFVPARELYRKHGFVECPPFGEYVADPNSVFMSRDLR